MRQRRVATKGTRRGKLHRNIYFFEEILITMEATKEQGDLKCE
jgi:hypothetical protein